MRHRISKAHPSEWVLAALSSDIANRLRSKPDLLLCFVSLNERGEEGEVGYGCVVNSDASIANICVQKMKNPEGVIFVYR